MNNTPSLRSGFFNPRVAVAVVLLLAAAGLGWLSFAANPAGGSITPTTTTAVTWNGTASGIPPTAGGESSCIEGTNCDSYKLTLTGNPSDWAGKLVRVRIEWLEPGSDYDLFIHKGTLAGPVVASSAAGATTNEQVDLNPSSSSIGTGDFTVHVVYFAVVPADQYRGIATVLTAAPGPIPAPTPANAAMAPRFELYNPPAAGPATLGRASGEPSVGVGLPIAGHPEGRALFQADVQTLRVTFNGCAKPLWENKPAATSQVNFDPILWTDRITGQTVVHLLTFAGNIFLGESSVTNTNAPLNDGDIYQPSQGAGIASGIDHQTVGGGAYHAPLSTLPPNPAYPRTVYYCSQALADASCARSDDGGLTYGPSFVVYASATTGCGGLHGHVQVGTDGSVYLPNKGCTGGQAVVVSEDNGVTWTVRPVPGSVSSGSDPSVGIDAANRVYIGYADGDTKAVVSTSTNQGRTWSQPLDVGAQFGINNVVFPAVVAGSSGRAAFAFLGTPTAGGLQGRGFTGVWHLYIAATYDGGQTWKTVDATPNDPVQRGCIWLGGGANVCRNMLDFMDLQIDQQGRLISAYADGCAGAECKQASDQAIGNSYTALAAIARQSGGPRMLAAFDPPATATVPGTPKVSALRNGGVIHLAWSLADTGGSPITSYTILRGTAPGMATTPIATVAGTQLRYDDQTATNTSTIYYYKVVANNGVGASCGDNEISSRYVGASTDPTNGYTLSADPADDQVGGPAANKDLDIRSLAISEPANGPLAGKLVFKLKMTDLSLIANNRMWRIVWGSPASPGQQFYVGMTKDANGVITYDYGTVATATVGLVLGLPSTTRVGSPDFGAFDPTPNGVITIAVSKDKVGNPKVGDVLGAFSTRTYPNTGNEIRSTNAADTTGNATANDATANSQTYQLIGAVAGVSTAYSRKKHGDAGDFDIELPIAGSLVTEPRQGPVAGSHTIVVTFVNRLTSVGPVTATATTAGGTVPVAATGAIGTNPNEYVINVSGVPNISVLNVTVTGAVDSLGNAISPVPIQMGVLLGDTNGDRSVNSGDATQTRSRSGLLTDATNFRSDVNTDGVVNSGDATIVRARSGNGLSAPAEPESK